MLRAQPKSKEKPANVVIINCKVFCTLGPDAPRTLPKFEKQPKCGAGLVFLSLTTDENFGRLELPAIHSHKIPNFLPEGKY